jgi:hypothetical protein
MLWKWRVRGDRCRRAWGKQGHGLSSEPDWDAAGDCGCGPEEPGALKQCSVQRAAGTLGFSVSEKWSSGLAVGYLAGAEGGRPGVVVVVRVVVVVVVVGGEGVCRRRGPAAGCLDKARGGACGVDGLGCEELVQPGGGVGKIVGGDMEEQAGGDMAGRPWQDGPGRRSGGRSVLGALQWCRCRSREQTRDDERPSVQRRCNGCRGSLEGRVEGERERRGSSSEARCARPEGGQRGRRPSEGAPSNYGGRANQQRGLLDADGPAND